MVKRLLFLTVGLLFFQISEAFSQISIGTVDPGPYTPGSSIAAMFSLGSTTCIRPGSQFELFLSDASGNFGSEVRIGTFNSFYSTFVNGLIPAGTTPGTGYRVRVKSTNPALVSAQSAAFEIRAGAAVLAQVSSAPVIGTDMFGFCPGRDNWVYNFTNQSTATSSVTATITNELSSTVASTLTFSPPTQPKQFTASLAHYTVFVKAQMPDGSVGTKAYMLVNNNVFNSFSTTGSNVVCLPGGFLQYGVDVSASGILNNYPGNTYEIIWGDGITDTYTFCDLKSGFVRHEYLRPSCGNPPYSTGGQTIYNVFGINISVISPCGPIGGAISTYVRVVTKPENRFSSPEAACTNRPVTFTNNSIAGQNPGSNTPACSDNNVLYNWYVDGVLMLANVPRSTDFVHTFTSHGVYDIKLESITNGVCEGVPVNHPICIQDPPQPAFDFGGAQLTGCAPFTVQAFDRSVIDAICNVNNTYNWIVNGPPGVQFDPTAKNPVFIFNNPGTYEIILEIQTASCGAVRTQIPQQIVLADGAPVATLSADAVLCALNTFHFNDVAGPTRTILTGTQQDIPNTTYTWYVTESGGGPLAAGDFEFVGGTDLHTKNPLIKFNQFKTYRIRVVHINSCGQTEDSQLITFSPSPVPDIVVNPNPVCYDGDVNLQGTITNGTYTSFQWIGNGGTFSAPLSLTTTYTPSLAERNAGTTTIRLVVNTGLQGTCAQVEDNVVVNILPNNTGTNATQQICSGTAVAHTPASSVAGSTYSWSINNPDGNASGQVAGSGIAITDVITNNSLTTDAVVIYTITPVSNGCTGVPYTFTVTVTPRPVITAVPARPTICSSEPTNITLTSNLPNTTYTWTSTVSGTVTGNTNASPTPVATTVINNTLINIGTAQGSVTYLITPYSAAGCAGTPVSVTVNVDPAVTVANAGADRNICATNSYTLEALPAIVGTGTWSITSSHTSPPLQFGDVHDPTTTVTGLTPGETYRFTWTISAPGVCTPTTDVVIITVNEPTIPGTTAGNPTIVCANNNTGTITLSGNVGNVIGWESSPDGTTWALISGTNIGTTYTFNNLSATTHFRAIVQNGGCTIERSSPTIISVAPATTPADAGMGRILCNEQSVTLTANPPAAGETGLWTMVSGNVNAQIATPANPQTTVAPLAPGVTYVFRWTITGNAPCGPKFSDVTIRNNDPIGNNTISTNTVVCSGQQVLVDGSVPTGGDGTYTYTWEMQENNGAWMVVPNATGEDLTTTLTTSTIVRFRRNVSSGECTLASNEFPVTVQPPIANNTVAADQPICSGSAPAVLTGSMPTGGDGQFLYQWQSSQDGTIWTDIPGALAQNYQPPILTQTTFYRRTVGTLACSGSFQSASARVMITVNPNARAEFTWGTSDTGCAPYALPIVTVPYPDRNATYTWYANNVVIPSTGSTFPGYTITTSNQSVTIKLVVTSRLGCAPAELEHIFSTNQAVPASFTPVSTTDCGPLDVNFVNTSNLNAGATFRWNFGNGRASNDTNPPTITFQPDPSGKDTTYIVTLYSITTCGVDSAKGTVLVKSGPKPIFSPSTTSGCSPLPVDFTNNSPLQTGIEYFFDFGDGSAIVRTTDRSTVTHTYRTTTNTQTFNATLTAVNLCGRVTTLPYAIVVRPNTVNAELVVNGNQLRGCAPFSVTFDNNSTGATDFIVDFNDGTQPRQSIIFPERFMHTFTAPGTYVVTLTATNGCSTNATTETITVLPQPLTEFEADNTLGCPGLIVKFKNNTQNGVSYIWDFGDGSPISNEFEPTHAYTGDQEYYTVTLTTTNNLGCTMAVTKNQYIHIVQPPVAAFNVNPSTLINIPDYTFRFEDQSTNSPTIWQWDFGDGTSSALKNPSHTYLDTGTYKVTLRVLNQQGCFTSTFKNVTIKGVPGYLFVPNSFVPGNTQPELREFRAKGSGIATWRFSIFNKWGQLLWETTKLEEGRPIEGWDGTFKGQQLPQGVYFWKVDVQMVNGSEWKGMTYDSSAPRRTGPIHLIR